jgi:hypothetical protein
MTSTEYFQYQVCHGRATYDFMGDPENALMNFLINPWIKKVGAFEGTTAVEYNQTKTY